MSPFVDNINGSINVPLFSDIIQQAARCPLPVITSLHGACHPSSRHCIVIVARHHQCDVH
jgi:hypothetical protein